MKETKSKIIALTAIIIIIVGIIVIVKKGFNFDLENQEGKRIELNIGKSFENSDIEAISKEALGGQEVVIQKIEIYEDAVSIFAKEITEEQRKDIVTKINEKYEKEIEAENIEITKIPHLRLRDIMKKYILPFAIATILILIYVAIRYMKLSTIQVIGTTAVSIIEFQLLLFSIIAITRIPIGKLTLPLIIITYILALIYSIIVFEHKLLEEKEEQ